MLCYTNQKFETRNKKGVSTRNLVAFLVMIAMLLNACSWCCQRDHIARFLDTYSNIESIDDYCKTNDDYLMCIEFGKTRLQLLLNKERESVWKGEIAYYLGTDKFCEKM